MVDVNLRSVFNEIDVVFLFSVLIYFFELLFMLSGWTLRSMVYLLPAYIRVLKVLMCEKELPKNKS